MKDELYSVRLVEKQKINLQLFWRLILIIFFKRKMPKILFPVPEMWGFDAFLLHIIWII